MDLTYTPEEIAFRKRVREWIAANKPAGRPRGEGRSEVEERRAWHLALQQQGFIAPSIPEEYGGGSITPMEQAILNEELAQADAPPPLGWMGLTWVAPAILRFGSDEQRNTLLPRVLRGDDIWATGYSEPNAGSDMYNTQTRAVRQGDEYVIDGQKIWTSQAVTANWYFLLTRTSSEGHKVAGLTLFLVPMDTPGVDVRPIKNISGGGEFSEVFLKDVHVPVSNRLGEEGQGYEIVSSALINERTGIAGAIAFDRLFDQLMDTARRSEKGSDPYWQQRIAELATKTKLMKAMGLRVLSDQLHDRFNPHTSAAMKCIATSLQQEFAEVGMSLQESNGMLLGLQEGPEPDWDWGENFLHQRAATIAGGTSEIQRNIVAERVLGLPRR